MSGKPLLRFLLVFALVTSIINMGASCEHENSGGNVLGQIGGVTDVVDDVVTHPSPDRNLAQGIDYYKKNEFDKAIISFQKVLVTNPNNDELGMAYAGMGWSRAKRSGSVLDGEADFKNAYAARSTNQDARVGLASAWLLKDKSHIKEAVSLLESIGMTGTSGGVPVYKEDFEYVSEIGTGISTARVHALLAACHYFNNENTKTQTQLAIAKRLDPSSDKVRSVETAINTLGF